MKKYLLLLTLTVLVACNQKDMVADELILKNNELLQYQLETVKHELVFEKLDMPMQFDEKFYNGFIHMAKGIDSVKTREDFQKILTQQKSLVTLKKIPLKLIEPASENIEYLKNSLYLNAININKERILYIARTGCRLSSSRFSIWERFEGDSVTLEFKTPNLFVVTTDSIKSGNKTIVNYSGNDDNNFWQIKYKSLKKEDVYYGKLFYNNNGKPMFLERFQDTISP